jgi:predicted transcriptional regulator
MKPNAARHDPRPEYLRALVDKTGLSQRAAAERIGISARLMRYYLALDAGEARTAPYPVQFALEALANYREP